MLNSTLEYYNKNASQYFNLTKDIIIEKEINIFLSFIENKDELILDLGCGSGNCLKYISDKGYKIIGIDFCDNLIKLAKEYTKALIYKLDFSDINVLNEFILKYNIYHIFANASLLHLTKNQFKNYLQNIILKGYMFFSLKEGNDEKFDENKRLITNYTQEEINELLKTRFKTIEFNKTKDLLNRGNNWLNYIVKVS